MMRLYCSKWTDCLDKIRFAVSADDHDSVTPSTGQEQTQSENLSVNRARVS
jgi:hypothetical protein